MLSSSVTLTFKSDLKLRTNNLLWMTVHLFFARQFSNQSVLPAIRRNYSSENNHGVWILILFFNFQNVTVFWYYQRLSPLWCYWGLDCLVQSVYGSWGLFILFDISIWLSPQIFLIVPCGLFSSILLYHLLLINAHVTRFLNCTTRCVFPCSVLLMYSI